jgi:glutathione S-transferase
MTDELPLLWQLKPSHYNEKARWALDHKGIPHVRRTIAPGSQAPIARRLTGSDTFPVLELDGQAIGESARIIAELERRHPEPPLYPSDPSDRRRALELEKFFDEELGPYSRRLLMRHVMPHARLALGVFAPDLDAGRRLLLRAAWPLARGRLFGPFGVDDAGVAQGFEKLRAAGERFRAEVGPSGYLVGDAFTVADLTLAALLSVVVAPEQFPYAQPQRGHPALAPVREALGEFGLDEWTRDIYARHRGRSAEVARAG